MSFRAKLSPDWPIRIVGRQIPPGSRTRLFNRVFFETISQMPEISSSAARHPVPPTRSFGLMVGGILTAFALVPLLSHGSPRLWMLGPGVALIFLALVAPVTLSTLTRAWLRLGDLLGKTVSPLALGVLFFGVFTPMGWLFRILHRDVLALSGRRDVASYWIRRTPPGPDGSTLRQPF